LHELLDFVFHSWVERPKSRDKVIGGYKIFATGKHVKSASASAAAGTTHTAPRHAATGREAAATGRQLDDHRSSTTARLSALKLDLDWPTAWLGLGLDLLVSPLAAAFLALAQGCSRS
jgi:hypothetical protein